MLLVFGYAAMLYCLINQCETRLTQERQDAVFTSNHDNSEDNCTNLLLEMQTFIDEDSDLSLNDQFEFCKDKVKIKDFAVICRYDTYVQMKWDIEYKGIIKDMHFLIEQLNINETLPQSNQWINNGWTMKTEYKAEGLRRNTEYSFRVTPYFRDVQLGHTVISQYVTTFFGNESLEPINGVFVENFKETDESLQGLLKWIEPKDKACQTNILIFEDGTLEHFSDKVDSGHSYVLNGLDYSSTYVVTLFTSVGRSESEKITYTFKTPSCIELNNYSLSKCAPDSPENLTLEDNCTNFKLSWNQPLVYPDFYKLIFQYDETLRNFTIPGKETSFKFEDYHSSYYYIIYMTAVSSAGESKTVFLSGMFKCFNRESISANIKTDEDSSLNFSTQQSSQGSSQQSTPSVSNTTWSSKSSPPSRNTIIIIIAITAPITIVFCIICIVVINLKTVKKDINSIPIPEDSYRKEVISKISDTRDSDVEIENRAKEAADETKYDEYEVNRGQVRLYQVLGEGEFGVVHKAVLFYENNSKYVAAKILRNKESLEEKRQMEKEMEVMKSVGKHRNIVSLLGCCTEDMMLIVEYCALGDLRRYLRKAWRIKAWAEEAISDKSNKNLLERNAFSNILYEQSDAERSYLHLSIMNLLSFARQIALGMAYLSENRVVHRDLAARNVLLAEDMTAKIADFGLSRDVYERNIYTKRSTDRLPLRWMALESLLYQVFSTKSDVWSYGILLWEIMTLGGCPYPSLQTSEMYKLLQEGYRMERPKPCNHQLYDIMLNCWDAKPQNRPSFSHIVDNLEDIMKNESNRSYLDLSAFDYKTHLDDSCEVIH